MSNGQHAERMAPHSVEAEQALLGALLINPALVGDVAREVEPRDFFIVRHEWVYAAILDLYKRAPDSVDYLTVVEALRQKGQLDEIGGPAYVTELIGRTPTTLYAVAYATLVGRAAIRRRLLNGASEIAQLAQSEDLDIHEVVTQAEAVLFDATKRARAKGGLQAISAGVSAVHDDVDKARRLGPTGYKVGYTDLDKLLGGFQDSDLILVAGRPGMGKTSFMLSIARNVASKPVDLGGGARRLGVAFFSLEMSSKQLTARLLAMETGISVQRQRNGEVSDREYSGWLDAEAAVDTWPIYLDESSSVTPLHIISECRRLKNQGKLDMVFVDYVQLMVTDKKTDSRNLEISDISRQMKLLAKELDVPVFLGSQLNRGVEARQDKRPTLADLRDSGALEQDADVIVFLYRDEVYNEDTDRPNQLDAIVGKNRNGPTGAVPLYFRKEITRIDNLSRTGIDLTAAPPRALGGGA